MAGSNGKRVQSPQSPKTKAKTNKRVRTDPPAAKRQGRSSSKKHASPMLILIPVIILTIVLLVYVILCVIASASTTFFPNTRVLGANLEGMTVEEAASYLSGAIQDSGDEQVLQIQAGEDIISVELIQMVTIDAESAAEYAFQSTHSTGIASGFRYLSALIGGCDVDISEFISFQDDLDSLNSLLDSCLQGYDGAVVQTSYEIDEDVILITKGTSGHSIDFDALQADILSAIESGDYSSVIVCSLIITEPDAFDLSGIYEEIYSEAVNASLDDDANVVEGAMGVSFDLEAAQSQLDAAEEGSVVSISLIFTEPDITAESLEELLFRYVLGTASSTVTGTSARISNVKLAASYCDGVILNPGESFSYNNVVGQRTVERGFQAAPAYSNGDTVLEVGGGICQVSSTIYLATLRSNLEIVERRNHSYICSYMPYGEDATVSWGGPDFVFKNDTDYPIKIVVTYSSGTLTATVYGTNLTGQYTVITNEVTSTTSYETVYQETTDLDVGKTEVKTTGYNGMTVKVYRNVYAADGTLISSSLESNNTYKVRNKVVLVGVADTTDETTTTDTETTTTDTETTTTDTGTTSTETETSNTDTTTDNTSQNTEAETATSTDSSESESEASANTSTDTTETSDE